VTGEKDINFLLTQNDLAFYATLSALSTLNRREIREKILSSSKFKNLLENVPEIQDIMEHFMNGRYMEF